MELKYIGRPTVTMIGMIMNEYPLLRCRALKVTFEGQGLPITPYQKAHIRAFVRDDFISEGFIFDNDAFEDALIIAATRLTPKEERD